MVARIATLMLLCALGGSPVGAQSVSTPANGDCLGCHEDPALTRGDGSALTVAPQPFEASVHGSFACVDCHLDLATVTEFPHPETLQRVQCGVCHDASMPFSASVHVRRPRARGDVPRDALTCASCHGSPHAIRSSTELASPTHKVNTARTCGMCHGDQPPPPGMGGPAVARMFADSIHGQALSGDGAMAPTCSDCHGSHGVLEKTSAESPVFRTNVAATCGTCHTGTLQEFHGSVHAAALTRGDARAPHCASCHTAHAVRATSEHWQLEAVQQCGTCHREALATYRDTFHGQVTRLGFAAVAKCADCHLSHGIRSAADAASTVAPGNLISTCGQCHRDANANFVKYQPHANQHDRDRLPQLYYAGRFMDTLLLGVFVFFGAHTTLWFLRERRGPPDPDEPAPDA